MNINLKELDVKGIYLDKDITFDESFYNNTIIKGIKNTHINANIHLGIDSEITINGNITGTMVLVDSYTNELIDYDFNAEIDEILENNTKNNNFILDLSEVLWQNIVLEVPIRTSNTGKVETLKGEGWSLMDENSKKEDPRLEVFKTLLEKGKE